MPTPMDEKHSIQIHNDGRQEFIRSTNSAMTHYPLLPSRRKTFILIPLILLSWFFWSYTSFQGSRTSTSAGSKMSRVHSVHEQKPLANVPLEAHIMSKCPDAKDCLRELVVPAMEKIVGIVDFNISFIGSINSDDTIECKHGETECLGNMLSLCAEDLFPNNTVIFLGFTTCLVTSYPRIPHRDLVENCALEHGIEFDALNACVSEDGKGLELLRESIERSKDAAVTRSCTVRVAGKKWCVRDMGKWKNCNEGNEPKDLVTTVQKIYNATRL